MTWNPIFPVWLLILITLALVGYVVGVLSRSPGQRGRWAARLVVTLLICVASFRPGIGTFGTKAVESSLDVLMVVDTTTSMLAEDYADRKPRLTGVKADVAALAEAHAGARFGVVSFANTAHRDLPFSSDATALRAVMDAMTPGPTRHARGSSISVAVPVIVKVLQQQREEHPDRAVVVYYFGDGEQTIDRAPESFASIAPYLAGGAVFGYGTAEGGVMRARESAFSSAPPEVVRDEQGREAISRIDEGALQRIAAELKVTYSHRDGSQAVKPADVKPERVEVTKRDVETSFELYWLLVGMATLILLMDVWRVARASRRLRDAMREEADDD